MSGHESSTSSGGELSGLVDAVGSGRISRRRFLVHAASLGLSATAIGALLAACGEEDPTPAQTTAQVSYPSAPPEDGVLHVYNWAAYLPDEIKARFEEESGLKIDETYYESNEALLAKLRAGATGYDVIVPSDYMVHILWKSGLLLPLDMSLIPNYESYVGEQFKRPAYDDEATGAKYSVPYQWGTTGIAVQTAKVERPITKWADLWDRTFEGDIIMLNDERETLGAGLLKNGYSINTTSQEELDVATADLVAQKPLLQAYDSANRKRSIVQGVPLVHCWSGDIALSYWADPDIYERMTYVLPDEGFPMFVDNLCIPVGAPSPYAAHSFLDFILRPDVQGELSPWAGTYTPVPEAEDLARQSDAELFRFMPDAETIASRGEPMDDVGEFAAQYQAAWREVMSA